MKYHDRVKETSTTTGTGNFTLAGAVLGFRTFGSVLSTNDTCYYCIALQGGSEWETGIGTYSATNTLTRTTILASSNGGSAVNFSSGTKEVVINIPAREMERPTFSANKNGTSQTSITGSGTWTKVTFTTEEWDSHGYYDAANSKFMPSVPGYYHIIAGVQFSNMDNNKSIQCAIYKNGSIYKTGDNPMTSYVAAWPKSIVTALVYLNGSTDYVEIYAAHWDSTSRDIIGSADAVYFEGARTA